MAQPLALSVIPGCRQLVINLQLLHAKLHALEGALGAYAQGYAKAEALDGESYQLLGEVVHHADVQHTEAHRNMQRIACMIVGACNAQDFPAGALLACKTQPCKRT